VKSYLTAALLTLLLLPQASTAQSASGSTAASPAASAPAFVPPAVTPPVIPPVAVVTPPAWYTPTCWPSSYGPIPLPGGTGSAVLSGRSQDQYTYWAWKCPDGSIGFKVVHDNFRGPRIPDLVAQVMKYPSILEGVKAMWHMYDSRTAKCTVEDPCDLNWPTAYWAAKDAALAIPTPIDPNTPRVAKNGKATTRPAYPVVDGKVGTKEEGRAIIDQPCDCTTKAIIKSGNTYCSAPPPNQTLVTLCR